MPSLGKRLSFATLKSRFRRHDSESGSVDLERGRKSSINLAGRRSETLPPEIMLPSVLYPKGELPVATPDSADKTVVGSPGSFLSAGDKPSLHQRAVTMPVPDLLPLDKPMPPLPNQDLAIFSAIGSPESFSSSQGPPSSQGSPSLLSPAPSQSPEPLVSNPVVNLHAIGVLAQVDAGPKTTKAEKLLNKLDDSIASANDPKGLMNTGMMAVKTILDSSGALKAIEAGVNAFVDDIPWLMKGLDEVAKIHPVVTVAVLAFKAVYTMEMTRRENDRRIRSLYVEMKEMISVLVQLKDVKDPKDVGPDGKTISARMQTLCEKAASDIKDCANACDSYSKKRLVVKVLKGYTWEQKLVGFVGTFTQRKTDFQQALAIHTARTVDAIQSAVTTVQAGVMAIDQKMELFMKMFAMNIPSQELTIRAKIMEKGDPIAIMNNEVVLRELNEYENETCLKQGSESSAKIRGTFTLKDLKEELHENLETAIIENFQIFDRKFTLHQNQLQEQLTRSLQEVIVAVKEGPHDRIKNAELKEMWKEMNWRRNVKASLFVMTLRDHFREKGEENSNGIEALEDWALKYIDATWLQSIMEAFDDDASGYITINELNRFTDARPDSLDWSLPHWIAYWAVGWQLTTQKYKGQIEEIAAKMYSMVPYLLPENRKWADYYLSLVWKFVAQITMALQYSNEVPEHIAEKFTAYVDYEEERLKKNLELIKYDIDALDTVHVVAGGRIEKHLLPMMYLLLSRDLKLFRVAQTKILNSEELWDAADSLMWVNDVVVYRMRDLTDLFKQRRLDVDLHFKKFACGMFDYMHNTGSLWSMSKIKEAGFQHRKYTLEELNADPEPEHKDVLNYAVNDNNPIATEAFSIFDQTGASAIPELQETNLVKVIQGSWSGYVYNPTEYPCTTMDTYHFNPNSSDEPTFSSVCDGHELDSGPYKLSGKCTKDEDGTFRLSFSLSYEDGKKIEYFIGHLDQYESLVGFRGWSEDVSETKFEDTFILRRVTPDVMRFRPSPDELLVQGNKYRALWKYAIAYTLHEVRKKAWSWSYFRGRRDIRKRYIKLNIAYWTYGRPLTADEHIEFLACRKALSPSESLLYRSIRERELVTMPKHHGLICDGCKNPFGGNRFLCLDCPTPEQKFWDTCDACDLTCFDQPIDRGELRKAHTPNHDILKLRTVLTYRDMPVFYQSGWEALRRARAHYEDRSTESAVKKDSPTLKLSNDVTVNGDINGKKDRQVTVTTGVKRSQSTDSEALSDDDHSDTDHLPPIIASNLPPAIVAQEDVVVTAEPEPHEQHETHCGVCQKIVEMPCWYCTQCTDLFLCDDCENKTLLACLQCHQPYVQPSWYYGGGPKDNFLCNVCTVKGISPPDVDKSLQHVYTHPIVRCKPHVDDPVEAKEPTTEERITTLERKASDMGSKLGQLVEKFTHMEQTLLAVEQTMGLIVGRFKGDVNGAARTNGSAVSI